MEIVEINGLNEPTELAAVDENFRVIEAPAKWYEGEHLGGDTPCYGCEICNPDD